MYYNSKNIRVTMIYVFKYMSVVWYIENNISNNNTKQYVAMVIIHSIDK